MIILALMVLRHELNLCRNPISGRYVAVTFHKHTFDHEYRIVRRWLSSADGLGILLIEPVGQLQQFAIGWNITH